MNIYQSGIADGLMQPTSFPPDIKKYLQAEEAFVAIESARHDTLIEACCADGRYAAIATQTEKNYIGIDIAQHQVAKAQQLHYGNNKALFYCGDIQELDNIFSANNISKENSLICFPFNSFGILQYPHKVLTDLANLEADFMICTYTVDHLATATRMEYYAAAGFINIHAADNDNGMRITSVDGLDSMVYTPQWFNRSFTSLGIKYRCVDFGSMGKAYLNFDK